MKTQHGKNFTSIYALAAVGAIMLFIPILAQQTRAQKTHNFNFAASQSRLNFELHNETGYEITEVYVSPNNTDDWQEDVLGQDTLANHESVNIKFSRQKQDYWDLKVVFKGGKESVWYKFDLSQITDITISFRNGKAYSTTKNGG